MNYELTLKHYKTMVKKWTTAIALIMIVFLSSCDGDKFYEENYYVDSFTQSYTVRQRDWRIGTDDSGDYFYYEFNEPNLTQYIYENGVMQAFLLMNEGNLTPLPFNDYWVNGDYMWTEQVTCELKPGLVTFILKYSDHITDEPPHYDYTFRVRFLW